MPEIMHRHSKKKREYSTGRIGQPAPVRNTIVHPVMEVAMGLFQNRKSVLPSRDEALPGRAEALRVPVRHFVNGNRIVPPFPPNLQLALFGLGCFWGAERGFWQVDGVFSTAVGYAAGYTRN